MAGAMSEAAGSAAAQAPAINNLSPLNRPLPLVPLDHVPELDGKVYYDMTLCHDLCQIMCEERYAPTTVSDDLAELLAEMKVSHMILSTLLEELALKRSSPTDRARYAQVIASSAAKLKRALHGDERSTNAARRAGAYYLITGAEAERTPLVRQAVQRAIGVLTRA